MLNVVKSSGWPTRTFSFFYALTQHVLTDPAWFWALASLVIIADAVLTQLIIQVVAYTEIDWETYMVQVELYLKGQHDYSQISGPTGPLVYPAGHVHIHHLLYAITDSGRNIPLAQNIFAVLYIVSLALTCGIYRQAGYPNYIVILLPLSKRLHSIFVLRLFNDCWSVVAMQASILAYQHNWDVVGTLLFSAALSVKMSILLYLPGLLVILVMRYGLLATLRHVSTIILSQILLALPFLKEHPRTYLQSSFDLSRAFLYKWTVNWKVVDEATFLSPRWANGLLFGHVITLLAFGMFRWCEGNGGALPALKRSLRRPSLPASLVPLTADYVATVLFTSNLIGILFARSLHYQFYSWYAQQIPFLAWKTPYPTFIKLAILLGVEFAWNIFPATPLSSGVLLSANTALLVGIWLRSSEGKTKQKAS